jgi:hypothetical protein
LLISDLAEELEMLKELALLADFGHCMTNWTEQGLYKVCLFPLLVTPHQDLGESTSTFHHRTGEFEEWTLHHRTGENHHTGTEERAEDTSRTLPSQTSKLNLLLVRQNAKSTETLKALKR